MLRETLVGVVFLALVHLACARDVCADHLCLPSAVHEMARREFAAPKYEEECTTVVCALEGQACGLSSGVKPCAPGLTCYNGVCVTPLKKGDPCNGTADHCDFDLWCDKYSDVCAGGDVGDDCSSMWSQCKGETICNRSAGQICTYAPARKLGETCGKSIGRCNWKDKLVCGYDGTCIQYRSQPLDESCDADVECQLPLSCLASGGPTKKCAPLMLSKAVGEPCSPLMPLYCKPGLVCLGDGLFSSKCAKGDSAKNKKCDDDEDCGNGAVCECMPSTGEKRCFGPLKSSQELFDAYMARELCNLVNDEDEVACEKENAAIDKALFPWGLDCVTASVQPIFASWALLLCFGLLSVLGW